MEAMILLTWLFMLVYGLSLLRSSIKRKTGVTLITLFFLPMVIMLALIVIYGVIFNLNIVDLYRIGCAFEASHYSDCYPDGYFELKII